MDNQFINLLQKLIEPYQVFAEEEVQRVNELEVAGGAKKSMKAQTELNALLDKGVERYKKSYQKKNEQLRNSLVRMAWCYKS